ncbi:unnamed protein product [Microthlaspi erraticum]|uniref:Uncharacterized protein n=1 Tax=Microthlaspi erraticum TaxID=1685480 RepID=A0A6D2KSW8_9BRAS|nr:unnamed protein product [Microthlaspi erraticum]
MPYQKFLKDAVQQRTREAQGMVVLTRECSAIIQRKVISDKKEDPGSFTLPCMLGPLSFKNSLCDLGSSVSLMPLSVAKRLGYHKYQACGISLVLADRSIRLPTGMLEDLPLRIGNVEIPTDFIVLEMDEEPTDPLILGRPFLATARAMIDVCEGTIELNLGKDLKMKFDIKDTMRKPTIEGQLFYVEEMDQLADELLEELSTEDPLQVALTKDSSEGYVSSETDEYKKLLDTFRPVPNILSIEGLDRPVCEVMAVSSIKNSIESSSNKRTRSSWVLRCTSQCPHHDFNNESLLSTFYRGCLARYREMLDTTSNGNFLNQDVEDGWQLVENIANSNGSYGEEYDRTNRSSTHHWIESDEKLRKDVKSLNEKLDKLILAQSTMKKVNFVSAEEMEPVQEGEDTQFAEVCYMSNGQGRYNKGYYNYKSNPAMTYRNTDVANPQDQVYPQQQQARSSQTPQHGYGPKKNYQGPQRTFPGQADGVVETSKKLPDINSKIENLNTRVYSLENHASSAAAAAKQGQLPGKAVQNPKEHCKVIFSQEGLNEEEDQERVMEEFCLLLNDDEIVAAEIPGVQNDQPEPVDHPHRLLSQGHKEVIHKFRRDLSEIGIELPSMESMSEAFEQMKMIKDVMANSDKVSELLEVSTHQINLLTSPTFLPKVKDQGKFTLPCTLGHIELDNALVDSGASINLISLTMAEKLGIAGALQRPTTSIMFGDATSKSPLGVFKNYHLKIGECIIQTDLTVMEMEEEKDLPLLLGTPFLSTVGASIDFHKQEVILHKVNSLVSYRLQPRGSDFCATLKALSQVERPRSDRPRADRLVQAPCVLDEESLQALFDEPLGSAQKEGEDAASKALVGEKRKDPPAQVSSAKPSQLTMTLFPTKFENGKIEYKIRYKGRSRPFSRAKALVTSEQSKDPTKLKELLSHTKKK